MSSSRLSRLLEMHLVIVSALVEEESSKTLLIKRSFTTACPSSKTFYLFIYLSRGIQFSRASLNGALTKHKNKDIETLKLDNLLS